MLGFQLNHVSKGGYRNSRNNYFYKKNSKTACYAVFNSSKPDDAYVHK